MGELPPRITVGLPVYNGKNYVREAIESVLHQTFTDFELLINDNCSTDGTAEICEAYARGDRRIHYLRQSRNLGASPNINSLVHRARGEYFIWIMHDDRHGSRLLELCSQVLDRHPDVVLAYPRMIDIDAAGRPIAPHPEDCHLMEDRPHERFERNLRRMGIVNARLGLIRTAQLRQTILIEPYHSSDHVHQAELTLLGKFYEVPEYLYFRRVHEASSLFANRDYTAINLWFDADYRGGKKHYRFYMYYGFCRVVLRHPEIGLRDQFSCCCAIQAWAWHYIHNWLGLKKLRLLRVFRGGAVHDHRSPEVDTGRDQPERWIMRTQAGKPQTIGIWGHFGGTNHGDECTVAAILQNVRRHCPTATIIGFSLNPADTQKRHGIPSFGLRRPGLRIQGPPAAVTGASPDRDWRSAMNHLRDPEPKPSTPLKDFIKRRLAPLYYPLKGIRLVQRFLLAIFNEARFLTQSSLRLRGIQMLIVAGSQPLMDAWDGAWWHPYCVFRWALLSRITRTKLVFLSVGAGPLTQPLARWFVRQSLHWASYHSYRDTVSRAVAASLGIEHGNHVFPDAVFSLDMGALQAPPPDPAVAGRRMVVGLNCMAHEDPRFMPLGRRELYEAYLRKLAEFGAWLIGHDYHVVVYYSDIADWRACQDIRFLLDQQPGLNLNEQWDMAPNCSFNDLIGRIQQCDVLIAARFHCLVLPIMLQKPVLALAYNSKSTELMESMGQEEYCLPIDDFEVEELIACFTRLEANRHTIAAELGPRVLANRKALDHQYELLLGPPETDSVLPPQGVETGVERTPGYQKTAATAVSR